MEEVEELNGTERGLWRVVTQGSAHILDLDRMTVTRFPGPGRAPSINDEERPIRSIEVCKRGSRGRWTMRSDDVMIDFYWHVTSEIQRIERLTGVERAKVETEAHFQRIDHVFGLYEAEEVARVLGIEVNGADVVWQRKEDGALLGFERHERVLFPGFQFDEELQAVKPAIRPLIALAAENDWQLDELTLWLCSPSGYFGNACPVFSIDQGEEVVEKFRAAASVEW